MTRSYRTGDKVHRYAQPVGGSSTCHDSQPSTSDDPIVSMTKREASGSSTTGGAGWTSSGCSLSRALGEGGYGPHDPEGRMKVVRGAKMTSAPAGTCALTRMA